MPFPTSATTGALLFATALTAAGLNLGVLGLGDDEPETTTAAVTSTGGNESIELLALPTAAEPRLLVAVTAASSTDTALSDGDRHDGDHEAESGEDETPQDDEAQAETKPTTPTETSSETSSEPTTTQTPDQRPTTTRPAEPTTQLPTSEAADNDLAPAAPRATEYITYEFDGVATVIVALHDGRNLEFWSATTAPGWVFRVDDDEASKVKIKFRPLDGGDEAEWELKSEDGQLKLKQEY